MGDVIAVALARTVYHATAKCLRVKGRVIRSDDEIGGILAGATRLAKDGVPVLVNVRLAKTDVREGSLSI